MMILTMVYDLLWDISHSFPTRMDSTGVDSRSATGADCVGGDATFHQVEEALDSVDGTLLSSRGFSRGFPVNSSESVC